VSGTANIKRKMRPLEVWVCICVCVLVRMCVYVYVFLQGLGLEATHKAKVECKLVLCLPGVSFATLTILHLLEVKSPHSHVFLSAF